MATQAAPEPTLLTLAEVARRANVSLSTVRREIDRGSLRAMRVGGRLVDPHDFRYWLEEGDV